MSNLRAMYNQPRTVGQIAFNFQCIHSMMETYFKETNSDYFQKRVPGTNEYACLKLVEAMSNFISCVFNDSLLEKNQIQKRVNYIDSLESIRNDISKFNGFCKIEGVKLNNACSNQTIIRKWAKTYRKHDITMGNCGYDNIVECLKIIWD